MTVSEPEQPTPDHTVEVGLTEHGGSPGADAIPAPAAAVVSADAGAPVPLAQQYADLPPAPSPPEPVQMAVVTGQVPADAHVYGTLVSPRDLAQKQAEAEAEAEAQAEAQAEAEAAAEATGSF